MKIRLPTVLAVAGGTAVLLLLACIAAPYLNVDQFGKRLQTSLERALGRRVELG